MKTTRGEAVDAGFLRKICAFCCALLLVVGVAFAGQKVVIVEGIGGEESFGDSIRATSLIWQKAALSAGHGLVLVDAAKQSAGDEQVDRLRKELDQGGESEQEMVDVLWLVLLGHGSAQGQSPKFALEGPDLSADELSKMLGKLRCPVIVVAGFSCGGAFVKPLSASDRVIVAATRSGAEENWTRFPRFLADALTELSADADGDGQVSLLEGWLYAGAQVESFFKNEGRMLTEHAVLEDTGDGVSVGVSTFKSGSIPDAKKVKVGGRTNREEGRQASQIYLLPNPVEAALSAGERIERASVERELEALRADKANWSVGDYQRKLEGLLLKLAAIYEAAQLRVVR